LIGLFSYFNDVNNNGFVIILLFSKKKKNKNDKLAIRLSVIAGLMMKRVPGMLCVLPAGT